MVNIRKLLLIITIVMLLTSNVYAYPIKNTATYMDGTLDEQSKHPEIKITAEIIRETNNLRKDKLDERYCVYLFVLDYMQIDVDKQFNKDKYRYSAIQALRDRKGTCLDYTLLYCALCRSLGYECNIVVGWSKTNPHAWCEVYDKQWIKVDLIYKGYVYNLIVEPNILYKIK